jgi:hypothetical protein
MMATCGGDLESSLGLMVAHDVGKIGHVMGSSRQTPGS